jgi:hypothetical protein
VFIQDERLSEAKHTLNKARIVRAYGRWVETGAGGATPAAQRGAAFVAVVEATQLGNRHDGRDVR